MTMPIEKGIGVIVHNILTERSPLYEISDWIVPLDLDSIGLCADDAATLNDDRLGRVLDSVAKSNRKTIFFRIALRMIKLFELDCHHVHQEYPFGELHLAF